MPDSVSSFLNEAMRNVNYDDTANTERENYCQEKVDFF